MEDEKGSPSTSYTNLRPKKPRSFDEMDGALWDCSVCTYKNNAEAFKCAICDTRKGTSTRKPKVNSQLVAQQTAQQVLPTPPKIQKMSVPRKNNGSNKRGNFTYSRLKNVDQDSERQMEVTVGDVTVIITDYKLLPVKDEKTPPESPGQLEPTATTITTATTEATPTTTPAESTETKLEQINCDTPAHPPLESKKTEVGETSEHESSEVTSS